MHKSAAVQEDSLLADGNYGGSTVTMPTMIMTCSVWTVMSTDQLKINTIIKIKYSDNLSYRHYITLYKYFCGNVT